MNATIILVLTHIAAFLAGGVVAWRWAARSGKGKSVSDIVK